MFRLNGEHGVALFLVMDWVGCAMNDTYYIKRNPVLEVYSEDVEQKTKATIKAQRWKTEKSEKRWEVWGYFS